MGNPYAPPEPGRPLPDRPQRPAGPPSPGGPRRRLPPDPEQSRQVARLVLRYALVMLVAVMCLQLPVPWQAAGIAFSVGGLALGVVALHRAVRARVQTAVVVSMALGLAMGFFVLLFHLALLLVWPATLEMQECRSRALTISAEEQCREDYERWLRERSQLGTPGSRDDG